MFYLRESVAAAAKPRVGMEIPPRYQGVSSFLKEYFEDLSEYYLALSEQSQFQSKKDDSVTME